MPVSSSPATGARRQRWSRGKTNGWDIPRAATSALNRRVGDCQADRKILGRSAPASESRQKNRRQRREPRRKAPDATTLDSWKSCSSASRSVPGRPVCPLTIVLQNRPETHGCRQPRRGLVNGARGRCPSAVAAADYGGDGRRRICGHGVMPAVSHSSPAHDDRVRTTAGARQMLALPSGGSIPVRNSWSI